MPALLRSILKKYSNTVLLSIRVEKVDKKSKILLRSCCQKKNKQGGKKMSIRAYVLNTGGTLGMVGKPLRPAKSADELLEGIKIPQGITLTLEDFPLRQDSTNINHRDRVEMGRLVQANYDSHDAFILLHGTDSLSETCAFLSMSLNISLQKPLFVIGAQVSKGKAGSDVPMQIANSLRVAKAFVRNEVVGVYTVCVGAVLDGSRVRKRNDSDFNAFHTPGRYPIAQAWPHVLIMPNARKLDVRRSVLGLNLEDRFETDVVTIKVTADTPPYVLTSLIAYGEIKGVIIECMGAGNIPNRKWGSGEKATSWIHAIQMATEAGVHVGILSPFEDGRVNLDRYELGAEAKRAGALSLESLTPAMADAKFRMAIARHPKNPDRIQKFLSTDLVGELLPGVEDEEGDE